MKNIDSGKRAKTSSEKDNNLENETKDEVTIVTKNEKKELMQKYLLILINLIYLK